MTPSRFLRCVSGVVFLLLLPADHPVRADDTSASESTNKVQAELKSAQKSLSELQKQEVLKLAAADVSAKRAADLEKQLADVQKRLAEEKKALAAVQQQKVTAEKQVAGIAARLKEHQDADQLVAVAQAVQQRLTAAQTQRSQLADEVAEVTRKIADQEQIAIQSDALLKKAKEDLPKVQEQLKKAREEFDAASLEFDKAKVAANSAGTADRELGRTLLTEEARRNSAGNAAARVAATIQSLEKSLQTLESSAKSAGVDAAEAGKNIAASIEIVRALHAKAAQVAASQATRLAEQQKQKAAAAEGLRKAQEHLQQQQQIYAEKSRAHFSLQLKVAELQNAEPLYDKRIADANALKEQLTTQQSEVSKRVEEQDAAVAVVEAEYVEKQQLAEAALEPLGRFVSFSRDVAPVFAKRCVACHNTRTAGGRLNMDSFAAVLRGGESGAAVDAHHAGDSLLVSMIEDGSMPKDADPLTKDEIARIRAWIDAGAPLDAGLTANAELFEIMPEMVQPLPPKTYRLPIPVTATAFSPDGGVLASSGYHEILLWNTKDGRLLRRITNVAERVYDLEFSADGQQLAAAAGTPGQLGEVKVFSVGDGAHLNTLVRTRDAVFAVAFSPDGKRIAAAGADRAVYVADVATGTQLQRIEDHADWVMDVNWSPDGKQLVSAGRDKTSKVFDAETGRSVITFNGHSEAVYCAAFLTDGKSVVSGGGDRQARVWTVADGKEARKIDGFGSDIFRIVVTPENHVLTASADRNAREHNLSDGKSVRTFAGHKDWVYTLSYNDSKKILATGSYDGEIRVW
ncbi:MAG: hypothetical protein KDA89_08460, partial [Planctomycetaceae bacterium]|nr:hypothetical protein [Planctomycetaceae bacterium]